MELQEAINHAREVAEKCPADNRDCAYQHDQLADWLEELKHLRTILGDEYDLDRLSVLCNQRMSMREEVSQRFSLTAKIPLDRLRELVEADRDGRCYISNVKIGERIYVPDEKARVIGCRVQGISLPAHGKNLILHLGGYPATYMWQDRENIDWWKNKEEAEAAMKGENDGETVRGAGEL